MQLSEMIDSALERVRQDNEHWLNAAERFAFYRALNPGLKRGGDLYQQMFISAVPITAGHYRYGSLAIITARYALHLWDETRIEFLDETKKRLPHEMLTVAQGVLDGTFDLLEAKKGRLLDDFEYFSDYGFKMKYDIFCASFASFRALETVLGTDPFLLPENFDLTTTRSDRSAGDVAGEAVLAYTVIDENKPGDWARKPLDHTFKYDIEKRLAFWEWWLTEAVPAAWEATPS